MLRKKVVGRVTMSLRQDIVVRAIENPFAAFSIMARSIIVTMGHVNAPASVALSVSTPRRSPSLSVFHWLLDFVSEAELFVNGRSDMDVERDASEAIAGRDMI